MVLKVSEKSYSDLQNFAAENIMTIPQLIKFMLRTQPVFYMEDLQILMLSQNNPTENLKIKFPEVSKEIEEFDQTLSSFWHFYYTKRKKKMQKEKNKRKVLHEGEIKLALYGITAKDKEEARRRIALHLSGKNIKEGGKEIKEATEFLKEKKEEINCSDNPEFIKEKLKECNEFLMRLM